MLHSCLVPDCRPCMPLEAPSKSARKQGAAAWAWLHVRKRSLPRSSAAALGLFAPLAAAFVAGRRRSGCNPTRHRHPRLRLFSSVIREEQQTASEVLVDFQTFWRWIVLLERRRGTRVLRTYRAIGRRVRTIMRRLLEFRIVVEPRRMRCSGLPRNRWKPLLASAASGGWLTRVPASCLQGCLRTTLDQQLCTQILVK
eukprot:s1976_g7.t2